MAGTLGPAGLTVSGDDERAHRGAVECAVAGDIELPGTAAALAAAYEDSGERAFDALRGRFTVALWDAGRRRGLIASDRLGARTLVYRELAPGTIGFAEELGTLLDALPTTPAPAPRAVASWLGRGTLEPDETLYEGIRRLPGGTALCVAGGRTRLHVHWQPRYAGTLPVGREEAVALVRSAAEGAVSARIRLGRAGILLSGGIDSSAVAALARAAGTAAEALPAFSATFPDHPHTDESELIEETVERLGLPWRALPAPAGGVLAATAAHVAEWRVPPASPTLFFQLPLLDAARREGVQVVLDGQGGDELFGCAPYLIADELRRLRLRSARRLAASLAGPGAPSVLTYRALRQFGLSGPELRSGAEVLRPEYAALLPAVPAPWRRLDGPRWWAVRADELTTSRERAGAHDYLRRKFGSAGLRGAHPFFDDGALVELMLQLPPELGFDERLDRPLLRAAVEGLLPDAVRLRTEKSFFDGPLVSALRGPDRNALAELLARPDAEIRAYVLPDVAAAVDRPPREGRAASRWAWRSWRVAAVALWLESLTAQ